MREVDQCNSLDEVRCNITELARELGANAIVTERVYKEMISAFIETELAEHASLKSSSDQG